MKSTVSFVDALAMHLLHPATFFIPTEDELMALKVGDTIKVCCEDERFWCIIESIDGQKISARVDNDLVNTARYGISDKDIVSFRMKNIYQIWSEEACD